MPQGPEPDVKHFLVRILNTISWVLFWMFSAATAGIYFELGDPGIQPTWVLVVFYTILVVSMLFLIRYIIRKWTRIDAKGQ